MRMQLDLEAGSLTVFKNGRRLGKMVDGGLRGERLCWLAMLFREGSTVRIGASNERRLRTRCASLQCRNQSAMLTAFNDNARIPFCERRKDITAAVR